MMEQRKYSLKIWEVIVFGFVLFIAGYDAGILWVLLLILGRIIAHLNQEEK